MLIARRIFALFVAVTFGVVPGIAQAQGAPQISFLRDAEIENSIRTFATPLFERAGVSPEAVHIHIVDDMDINAFVADGLNLFINAGLIMRTENAGQLIGVIAHETGHIAGGHLIHLNSVMNTASNLSLATTLLGIAAMIASRRGDVGTGIMAAGNDVAMRSFLTFSRVVEASADTTALRFLDELHMSSLGFLQFMELLQGEELLQGASQDPYVRTHPLTQERVDEIRHHVETSPWSNVPVPPQYVELHKRMRAKLIAFLKSPVTTLTLYKAGDTAIDARYARAIAYYRIPDLAHALPLMDGLIAERPNDPYFHEMKGQILFDNGRVKESVPEYQAAVRLLGNSPLIRIELGQAEMEAGDDSLLPDALVNLKAGTMGEPDSVDGWRLLSAAYNRSNDPTMAETALAEYSLQTGAWSDAVGHSERALKQLKAGTPIELRMEDVRVQAQQMRDRAQN